MGVLAFGCYNRATAHRVRHNPGIAHPMIHLFLYKIVDGYMAVNFSRNDQAFFHGR
jgi:hypothetical protein